MPDSNFMSLKERYAMLELENEELKYRIRVLEQAVEILRGNGKDLS